MEYALINDTKTEATKRAKEVCPSCGAELIVKCGEHKIDHWAHKGTRLILRRPPTCAYL